MAHRCQNCGNSSETGEVSKWVVAETTGQTSQDLGYEIQTTTTFRFIQFFDAFWCDSCVSEANRRKAEGNRKALRLFLMVALPSLLVSVPSLVLLDMNSPIWQIGVGTVGLITFVVVGILAEAQRSMHLTTPNARAREAAEAAFRSQWPSKYKSGVLGTFFYSDHNQPGDWVAVPFEDWVKMSSQWLL